MLLKEKSPAAMQVRSAVLAHYLEVTERLGFNPQSLLSKVGLTRAALQTADQPIALRAGVELLELTAQACDCENFGLLMAENRQFSDLGPVSLLLTHQRTVRDAINTTIQYRHLLNEGLAMYVEDAGELTVLREEVVAVGSRSSRQATELAVGVLSCMLRALLGPQWRPHSVNFIHSAPSDLEVHKRVFRCKLQFDDDFNGLVCLTSDMQTPIAVADPVMARYAQSFLEAIPGGSAHSVTVDVRKSIYLLLPMGRASIAQIAKTMGLNVRTLQRRLGEEGETFSGLVNAVRMELAHRYIANPKYPLGRIADLLGYSNHSAFTRWFIAQFKQTPHAVRSQNTSLLLL